MRIGNSNRNPVLFLLMAPALASVLFMQGCASLSQEECQVADWYSIGYEDGLQGRPAVRIGDHRKACAKHGITPDLNRYSDGRAAGLLQYCAPGNGYRLGRRGGAYAGVCPKHSESAFLDAYYAGRELHSLENHVRQLDHEVHARETELNQLQEEIASVEAELVIAGTTRKARGALLAELKALEEEALIVQQEMLSADEERTQQQALLVELRAQPPRW